LDPTRPPPAPKERHDDDRAARIARVRDIWAQTMPAGSTPLIRQYFDARRIALDEIPRTIRFLPAESGYGWHRWSRLCFPQMVGQVTRVGAGIVGITRTFLAPDGSGKAPVEPARAFSGPIGGGGVWLSIAGSTDWTVIGEGIESTLSAMALWGCGAGIAALSAGGIRGLILAPATSRIIIAVDNDENRAGQDGALDAFYRWQAEGRTVRVGMPPTPGHDFNDVLAGAA
jgi:putative DNA primase/helicase